MTTKPPRQVRAYPFVCCRCGRAGGIWTPDPVPRDRVPAGWTRSADGGKPVCRGCAWVDLLAIRLLP